MWELLETTAILIEYFRGFP